MLYLEEFRDFLSKKGFVLSAMAFVIASQLRTIIDKFSKDVLYPVLSFDKKWKDRKQQLDKVRPMTYVIGFVQLFLVTYILFLIHKGLIKIEKSGFFR